jgi:hypothetical protein
MKICLLKFVAFISFLMVPWFQGRAQGPGPLYTWSGTGDVRSWVKNFGTNTVVLDNSIAGELRITETGGTGANVSISDGPNRVRESSASTGGTDVTGLDFLEFEIGHNGSGPINVQFYAQGSTGFTFVALGPDLTVAPGKRSIFAPLVLLRATTSPSATWYGRFARCAPAAHL